MKRSKNTMITSSTDLQQTPLHQALITKIINAKSQVIQKMALPSILLDFILNFSGGREHKAVRAIIFINTE